MNIELLGEEHREFFEDMGYAHVCRLNGKIVGLGPFIYTVGIVVGMDETGYECRYCYHNAADAQAALFKWMTSDDAEPSDYIKRKG